MLKMNFFETLKCMFTKFILIFLQNNLFNQANIFQAKLSVERKNNLINEKKIAIICRNFNFAILSISKIYKYLALYVANTFRNKTYIKPNFSLFKHASKEE
jgi:hypothetical protein